MIGNSCISRCAGLGRLLLLSIFWGAVASLATAQTQIYDFVANAGSASWNSTGGAVTYGAAFDPAKGQASSGSGQLEDGSTATRIFTHPPTTGSNPKFIEATYSNISIPLSTNMVRFEAQVGFQSGATGSTGLNFSVFIQKGSEFFELSALKAKYDTRLNTLSADLTAYKGQTVTMKIRLEAGADTNYDWGIWKAVQIVNDGTTVFDFVDKANDGSPTVSWYNGSGQSIPWGSPPGSVGGALYTSAQAEDGVSYTNALETVPDTAGGGTHLACGQFNTVNIPSNYDRLKFIARVGFLNSATTTNGVTFEFFINLNDGSGSKLIGTLAATKDGRLDWFNIDLTPYKGKNGTTLYIRANGGSTPTDDLAIWTEARIIGYNPAIVYDFIGEAAKGAWSSGWALPPNNTLTFPNNSDIGICQVSSQTLEDGTAPSQLFTHPNFNTGAPDSYIQAQFDNVIIPNNWTNVRFSAKVGFITGAGSSDGVIFQVLVLRRGKVDTLCAITKNYTGSLATISGNLNGYQGDNISIILYVDPNANTAFDWAAWVAPQITAELPTQVYAADAGVVVNDGNNDVTAINKAVALARSAAPCEVLFSSGTHNLASMLTVTSALNLNLKGSVVSPTTFMMSDPRAGGIFIQSSSNANTRNIVIDYGPNLSSIPWTQGTVSEIGVGGANKFKFTIDSGYMELDNGFFGDPDPAGAIYWGTFHEAASPYKQPQNTVDFNKITTKVKESAGVWRLTVDRLNGATNGMRYMYHRRGGHQTQAHNSFTDGHFLFDNITQYAGPGLCFVGTQVEKIYVRNSNVLLKPSSGRIKTTNADGVHVQNCVNGPDVVDCVFEGMSDDGVNAYGIGYKIRAYSGQTNFTVETEGRPLNLNDHLRFFRPSTGTLGSGGLVQVTAAGSLYEYGGAGSGIWVKDITVNPAPNGSDIQAGADNDRFFSQEYGSNSLLVTGCTFRNYRGRGVLGAVANGLISYNTFQNLNSYAMWCDNGTYFNEGLQISNLVIDHNTISYCGTDYYYNQSNYSAVINVAGIRSNSSPSASKLHNNITITNNTITNWPRHAIYVASSTNVTISGNNLTNTTTGTKASSGRRGIMLFDNVQSVSATTNTVNDARPSGQVSGKLFLFTNSNGQLTTSGNSYTMNWSGNEITSISSY